MHASCSAKIVILWHAMEWAQSCCSNLVVVEVFPRNTFHFFGINCINAQYHLSWREATAICKHLLSQLSNASLGCVAATKQASFQFAFATFNLLVRHTERQKIHSKHEFANG